MTHDATSVGTTISTPRLLLRPWRLDDTEDAPRTYGSHDVTRSSAPALVEISDARIA